MACPLNTQYQNVWGRLHCIPEIHEVRDKLFKSVPEHDRQGTQTAQFMKFVRKHISEGVSVSKGRVQYGMWTWLIVYRVSHIAILFCCHSVSLLRGCILVIFFILVSLAAASRRVPSPLAVWLMKRQTLHGQNDHLRSPCATDWLPANSYDVSRQ